MQEPDSTSGALLAHVVTLECKDADHAERCLEALAEHGRPDATEFNCASYDFGLKQGTSDTVYIVERWNTWADLDDVLAAKVVPALPIYNALLKRPFDPATDTVRIEFVAG